MMPWQDLPYWSWSKGIGWSAATLNPFSVNPYLRESQEFPSFRNGNPCGILCDFQYTGNCLYFLLWTKVSKNPSKSLILGDKLDINFNREGKSYKHKDHEKADVVLLEILVSLIAISTGSLKLGVGQCGTGRHLCADGHICRHGQPDGDKQDD